MNTSRRCSAKTELIALRVVQKRARLNEKRQNNADRRATIEINLARNWTQIRGEQIIKAVKEAGLPYDGMVTHGTTWVPRWVGEAIKLFNDNGGYADMTLAEFLKKMNEAR